MLRSHSYLKSGSSREARRAGDGVGEHVHVVAALEQVEAGLQHAHVRLDAAEQHGPAWLHVWRTQEVLDLGRDHGEECLVKDLDAARVLKVLDDLWHRGAQARRVLRRDEHGHVEDLGGRDLEPTGRVRGRESHEEARALTAELVPCTTVGSWKMRSRKISWMSHTNSTVDAGSSLPRRLEAAGSAISTLP